jgi:vacuolar protein sorting-associated protein 35
MADSLKAQAGVTDADQDRYLSESIERVQTAAFYMARELDAQNCRKALSYALTMAKELSTQKLSPDRYFELFMGVTDELREFERMFEDLDAKDAADVVDYYDIVQFEPSLVPRLYLLVTLGSVYIKSDKASAGDILFDLVEMVKGVQHPMRGLFLRSYLSQISKDKQQPSAGQHDTATQGQAEEDGAEAGRDAVDFVLSNFSEMNKLWVRLQHQGAMRDKKKREDQRRKLRQLVGTNLVRLSELDDVDLPLYEARVLPNVLEQIVNCKDVLAQEYLMDCVIQVFPAEWHLATLDVFLSTCSQLQARTNVMDIIITLMNRLSGFYADLPPAQQAEFHQRESMFPVFQTYVAKIVAGNASIVLKDILRLQVALVNFSSKCYPAELGYIDNVLEFSAGCVAKQQGELDQKDCVPLVVQLLSLPLESISLRILELKNYGELQASLPQYYKKEVAVAIVTAVLSTQTVLDTIEKTETLFQFLTSLCKDERGESVDNVAMDDGELFEFDREQTKVAELIQMIRCDDPSEQFALYKVARKHFGESGVKRMEYTLAPLVLGSIELAGRVTAEGKGKVAKNVFGFVHETVCGITSTYPDLALRLFLQGAQGAARCEFEAIAYEFMAQSYILYEDEITDSKNRFEAITYITGTLQRLTVFDKENYDTLISKATLHSAKLLRKTDKCRAVYNCSHLFWPEEEEKGYRDEKRLLQVLQRSLKIADTCQGSQVYLFVEILNKYLYFFDRQVPIIVPRFLHALIALIEGNLPALDNSPESRMAKQHYQNTTAHIHFKQSLEGEVGARYKEISTLPEDDGEK